MASVLVVSTVAAVRFAGARMVRVGMRIRARGVRAVHHMRSCVRVVGVLDMRSVAVAATGRWNLFNGMVSVMGNSAAVIARASTLGPCNARVVCLVIRIHGVLASEMLESIYPPGVCQSRHPSVGYRHSSRR